MFCHKVQTNVTHARRRRFVPEVGFGVGARGGREVSGPDGGAQPSSSGTHQNTFASVVRRTAELVARIDCTRPCLHHSRRRSLAPARKERVGS